MTDKSVKIEKHQIASKQPAFIIAEAGVNHNGSLVLAKKMVDAAKKMGADAIKFQVFKAEKLVTACPKCQIHLKCLQRDVSEPEYPIEITDFSIIINEALKEGSEKNDN